MHRWLPHIVALTVALAATATLSAPAPEPVRAEIDALLKALQTSGCEFNRNGTWYSAVDAQAHLSRKLEYLEGKSLVKSAEDFIQLGASTSLSSGKPYLVRCGSAAPTESRLWLQGQLTALRQAKQ